MRDGRLGGRRPRGPGPALGAVRGAAAVGAGVGARHAGRPLPQRRVRRAATAGGVGPRDRGPHRPPRRATARRHLGRDDPRPRALRRVPRRQRRCRPAGRRARRGDGLRVAGGRRLHAGDVELAHRGHHARPGAGHAGARPARPAPVLEGRHPGPAVRARPGGGKFVREVGALPAAKARERVALAGLDEWATDNLLAYLDEQKQATRHLPSDRTIVVERFRDELGDWRVAVLSPFGAPVHAPWALCVSARMRERFGVDVQAMHGDDGIVFRLPDLEFDGLGDGCQGDGADDGAGASAQDGRSGRARRHGRADVAGPPRARRGARPGDRADRRVGPVRGAVPRVRGPGPAAAETATRPPAGAVAAAAAVGPAARGRQPVPLVPHRPRGGPRVRPGRLRRARAGRPDDPDPVAGGHDGRRGDRPAVAVRAVADLRLRRAVHLRGRLAAGRAPGGGALAGPDPAGRAARPGRRAEPARPARPRGGRPDRGRAAAPRRLAPVPRRRGRRRPAPSARPAPPGRPGGAGPRRARTPGWSATGSSTSRALGR